MPKPTLVSWAFSFPPKFDVHDADFRRAIRQRRDRFRPVVLMPARHRFGRPRPCVIVPTTSTPTTAQPAAGGVRAPAHTVCRARPFLGFAAQP